MADKTLKTFLIVILRPAEGRTGGPKLNRNLERGRLGPPDLTYREPGG